ncbi:MAG: uncharacterized protein A8A55_2818 [Amphiamblys sp. WSBS2006]|nr:MAG: uncharacterized protein A8A55_2818 [Amphiamblys sp. WSBS2006]
MDQEKFLSDFLSGCKEAAPIHMEALVAASIHSAAELSVLVYKRGEQVGTADTQEEVVALEHAVKRYSFALKAKRAWERKVYFQRMVPFPPFNAADNLGMMKNLFAIVSEEVDATESVSLEEIKGIYPTWKKKFLGLMKKIPEPSERELQVSFSKLLGFWSVEETDIRQFVDLTDLEGDIMVQEDFSFVEIKKNKEFTVPRLVLQKEKAVGQSGGDEEAKRRENQPLVAEMYRAALHALYKAIWGGKTGKQKIKLAVMSLPWMMSRLGSVEVELDKDGMLVGKGRLNIGILQVWKSGPKDQENPAGYSFTREQLFEVLVALGKNEEEARAGVEEFRAAILSKKEEIMAEYIRDNNAVSVDEDVAVRDFISYTQKCFLRTNPWGIGWIE